jgi:hypothetical protein
MVVPEKTVGGAALLAFRDPPDIFAGASKAKARQLRDAAIPDTAEFDAHAHLCIELRWRQRGVRKTLRQVRQDGAWLDLCFLPDRDD